MGKMEKRHPLLPVDKNAELKEQPLASSFLKTHDGEPQNTLGNVAELTQC